VKGLLPATLVLAAATGWARSVPQPLNVCADPNNMPFSNQAHQGFENKIIELVARDLGQPIHYVWWAQRRGYVRRTLNAEKCQIWPGIATDVNTVATTLPYYRSTYVFVTRADAPLDHLTLDDARLKTAAIGVQMIGNDSMNTPPAHAIAERGLTDNVRGYMVYADYHRPHPTDAIIAAVENKDINVAIVWGPLAGYYAFRSANPLRVDAVTPATDTRWPMAYGISMGVRRGDEALRTRVNAVLDHEKTAIDAILRAYHVPRAPQPPTPPAQPAPAAARNATPP
jgi:mxaJ protein